MRLYNGSNRLIGDLSKQGQNLSSRFHVLVRLERLVTPKTRATWIDPKTGQRKEAGVFETYSLPGVRQVRHANYQWFTTPDTWEDAVLYLEGVEE